LEGFLEWSESMSQNLQINYHNFTTQKDKVLWILTIVILLLEDSRARRDSYRIRNQTFSNPKWRVSSRIFEKLIHIKNDNLFFGPNQNWIHTYAITAHFALCNSALDKEKGEEKHYPRFSQWSSLAFSC